MLAQAVDLERAALAYYQEASGLVPTNQGRRLLRDLAREAGLHVEIVQAESLARERTGRWLSLEEAASAAPEDGGGPEGSAPTPPPLPADADEADILAQALELAAQLYQLYQQLQASVGNEAADALEFLLRQEAGHCAALQERLAHLRGEYRGPEEDEPGAAVDEEGGPRRARKVGRRRSRPRQHP